MMLSVLLVFFCRGVDMWRDVPSSVGDHRGEVAELEWGGGDLTLSHAHPHDRRAVPVAMATAQVCRVGDAATSLVGDVYAEGMSETKAVHVASPTVDGAVFGEIGRAVVDHLLKSLTEIGVAALSDGLYQSERRTVGMAADVETVVVESAVAGVGLFGGQRPFGEHLQCLCGLEGRAGRVRLGDGAVHTVVDFVVAIETEDATCCRFYGHDASLLALQQLTGQALESRVESERGGVGESDDTFMVIVVVGGEDELGTQYPCYHHHANPCFDPFHYFFVNNKCKGSTNERNDKEKL